MEEELEWIKQTKQDPEAFGRLYDRYYQLVFGFMYNRTGHAEVAKDLTSETFFQALKNFHKYKPQKNVPFKSWLFSIAVAQVANYYRQRSKMMTITTEEAPELVDREEYRPDIAYRLGEDEGELKQQIELLHGFLKELSPKYQTMITLRYFSHMTVPEIAQITKTKEGTIKSILHRAIKQLQEYMDATKQSASHQSYEQTTSSQSGNLVGTDGIRAN